MADLVVLGGGFGGITAALELRARLPAPHKVTLIDQGGEFVMGLSHVWALDGRRPIERGRRSLDALRARGIEVVRAPVERIDVAQRRVHAGSRAYAFDRLVLALGAELVPGAVPGFAAAHNLYDARAVPALAAALDAFAGGRILLAISSMPFKCPAAPYEAAMVIASLLERRGVRDGTEIELTTPEPRPLPVAPASCSADLLLHVKSKGIAFAPDHRPKAVHADRREVEYENGARKTYDLLIGVPVHRAPAVVREAGLTDASGWVPVDPRTLETPHRGVFAVGDVNTIKLPVGKPLPKAGVFAEAQAKVVAANIAADLLGRAAADAFDGRGSCFVELGDGIATAVQGEFYASPEPVVRLAMPTREALAEKERFETDRLRAWFGG